MVITQFVLVYFIAHKRILVLFSLVQKDRCISMHVHGYGYIPEHGPCKLGFLRGDWLVKGKALMILKSRKISQNSEPGK